MPTPKNERKTENVVRDELRRLGSYKKGIVVEEQRSEIATVKRLLRAASKSGQGGSVVPEFIVSASERRFPARRRVQGRPERPH